MQIEWNGFKVFYTKTGNGRENLLLFHGFGQDRSVFRKLIERIDHRYTCYSFDLFFHGEASQESYSRPLTHLEWKGILTRFLEAEHMDRFSLLGFSIGTKLVLSTLLSFPTKTFEVFFIAPEGIIPNPWYRFATATKPGQWIFKMAMQKPAAMTKAAAIAEKSGLIGRKIALFAKSQTMTSEQRQRVFNTWMILSGLHVSHTTLLRVINQSEIKTTFFVGRRDRLANLGKLREFSRLIDHNIGFHLLNASHLQMIDAVTTEAEQWFTMRSDNQY